MNHSQTLCLHLVDCLDDECSAGGWVTLQTGLVTINFCGGFGYCSITSVSDSDSEYWKRGFGLKRYSKCQLYILLTYSLDFFFFNSNIENMKENPTQIFFLNNLVNHMNTYLFYLLLCHRCTCNYYLCFLLLDTFFVEVASESASVWRSDSSSASLSFCWAFWNKSEIFLKCV